MQRLDSLLPDFLQRVASNDDLTLIFLQELWAQIVGEELARRTMPQALKRKTLVLEVTGEDWQRELSDLRSLLIRSINDFWQMKLIDRIECQTPAN